MIIGGNRRIYKAASAGAIELRELLEFVFVGELLSPSKVMWLVSPWVSDVNILDNRGAAYESMIPESGRRLVRLSEVLLLLMRAGTILHLVVNTTDHNKAFVGKMRRLAAEWAVEDNLVIAERLVLHTKGIVTDVALISGSMNITHSGLIINDEAIEFNADPAEVANARLNFEDRYLEAR